MGALRLSTTPPCHALKFSLPTALLKRRFFIPFIFPQMKTILSTRYVEYPKDVTIEVNSRVVKVTGTRGSITREFKHQNLDMQHMKEARKIRVDLWFGNRKQLACIRTICSHIENMIKGVRIGYIYKMRFVYSHFPINVSLVDGPSGKVVEIRNFMGEKRVRKIPLLPGVDAERSKDVKDQLELSGIDITKVSLAAAQVQQMTNIRNKDIRKFLDGKNRRQGYVTAPHPSSAHQELTTAFPLSCRYLRVGDG